jgi:hypothetical protein
MFTLLWSLIFLLCLSSVPANAKWVVSSSSKMLGTAYADPDTIQRKGHLVKMWRLVDLKTADTQRGIPFLSSKGLDEYDCTEERSRIIATFQYSGQMGSGQIVSSDTGPGNWASVMPGSVDQGLWKVACGKKK